MKGKTDQADDNFNCNPIWKEGEPRWSILLATPKSGSTYVQQMINSHPRVWFGRERIMEGYRDCRKEAAGHCTWEETKEMLVSTHAIRRCM